MNQPALVLAILLAPTVALAQEGGGEPAGGGQTVTPTPAAPDMKEAGTGPAIFKHGTLGLGFTVPTSAAGYQTIDVVWFADATTAYDLIGGVNFAQTPDTTMGMPPVTVPGTTLFGFAAGFGYRMYKHHSAKIHTFLEPSAVLSDGNVKQFGDTIGLGVGLHLGAEAMFTDWFSISGQVGVELDLTQKFKQINFNTARNGLFANFYWE